MRSFLAAFVIGFMALQSASAANSPIKRPKLVVMIVIDQFRADYLTRFDKQFSANGFRALINNGAYFPYGEYDILQSMTGPGHATVLTGAYPYRAGIPINDWWDSKNKKEVYCVEDDRYETVGAPMIPGIGTAPTNLFGTTVGDEIKNADYPGKVVSIALKDRASILMGGKRADLAMWWDSKAERWVSSTYYVKDGKVPAFMTKLNKTLEAEKCVLNTPCASTVTANAFKALFDEYKLGRGKATDLIAVSFSAHDYAGHKFGANSQEMIAMTLSEDKAIADIRAHIAKSVPGGLKDVVFVLTGDHGVAPDPDYLKDTGIATGRVNEKDLVKQANEVLTKKYGKSKSGHWVEDSRDFNFYLDEEAVATAKIDMPEIQKELKGFLERQFYFANAFTQADWEARTLPPGMYERQINKTYFKGRSGHVIAVLRPFYINDSKNKATHITGYTYDRMVPIVISGFGVKPGIYADKAEVVDIAPTLSFLIGTIPPALSEGKVLKSALK